MFKKIKKLHLLAAALFIIFIFTAAASALALEIKDYPSIPLVISPSENCTGSDCLSIYAAYLFGVLIYIAGAIALISFAIGAIGLIAAGDSAEAASGAKDRMKGALLGLLLTMASFLIIRTINPTLITPALTPLPGVQGTFYYNGQEKKPVGIEVANVADRGKELIDGGFNEIIYCCDPDCTGGVGPNLLIWEFPLPNFRGTGDGYGGAKVAIKTCGEREPIGQLGSFKMNYETAGVYYCLGGCSGNKCSGYMSYANNVSTDNIGAPFNGKIGGVRIVTSDFDTNTLYGAVFHERSGLENGGECDLPIVNKEYTPKCIAVKPGNSSAVNIFTLNTEKGTSGDGITFYSEPYGWTGSEAGFLNVPDKDIKSTFPFTKLEAKKMCFDYTNVDQPDNYKYKCFDSQCGNASANCLFDSDCPIGETCDLLTLRCTGVPGFGCSDKACETFQDCPRSMQIKGSYLVAIYSKGKSGDNSYCRTFKSDVPSMHIESLIAPGSKAINEVYMIPTK